MNNRKRINQRALAAAIGLMLLSGTVVAQDAQTQQATPSPANKAKQKPSDTNAQSARTLDQVVVTGTPTVGGIRKIDASYSITTASSEQIKELNPVSTADLLKLSPGVYPESSGGETGSNIEVAGFPSNSGAPFVTLQMNGSPLFPKWDYFTDAMFRLDDTIDRVEAVQGGPSVLYGNGQPGLIANFILKEGSSKPGGDVGLTYGSEGMVRLDGFYGFPIGGSDSGWYGSVGGFWRKSDGVRDPQFASDKGGQLSATLSHDLKHGSLVFYTRVLKDKNQWVTDTPIYNPSAGHFSPYPYFSPLTGTFGSNADRYQFLQTTPCFTGGCTPTGKNIDMADGQGGNMHVFGANLDLDFDNGWSLTDKALFVGGNMDTTAFYSTGANPTTLGNFINQSVANFGLPAGLTATAVYANNGQAADLNQNVTVQNPEYIHKRIHSISNEFRVSKEIFEGNTLTVGNYTAVYGQNHSEIGGLNMLLQARSNPNPIALSYTDGTHTYQLTDKQGLFWAPGSASWTAFNERWHGATTAFYLADEWTLGKWRLDGGVRWQHDDLGGNSQGTASGDLDANPYTVYNNNAVYLADSWKHYGGKRSAASWTLGANYELADNMSVYGRVNNGAFLPSFDDIVNRGRPPIQRIHNYEMGFKYQAPWIYADLGVYHRQFVGVPYTVNLSTGRVTLIYGSMTNGLNAQVMLKPFEHFSLGLSGNYMSGHYNRYAGCVRYQAQDGSYQCSSIDGMTMARQPKVQYRVTPAYEFPTSWGSMKFWVTYEHVGNRFGDKLEKQPLGSYYDLSMGAIANVGEQWVLSLRGTNMTNQIGITEGNARLFGFASSGGVILARSIQGREVNFQVKYKF